MSCLELKLPERWCKVCQQKDGLSKCGACQCILYCCKEHQIQHRPDHKKACRGIVAARTKLAEEKAKLETHPNGNPFEDPEAVGHFWSIVETRPYMQQLLETTMTIVQVPTPLSVEAAVEYSMESLRLCPADNMGIRSRIPNFLLRLGRDAECYDFIKYWRADETGRKGEKILDLKDQDIFEDVQLWRGDWPDLSHAAALTLIKIRLLINLETLEGIKVTATRADPNTIDLQGKLQQVRQMLISPWVFKRDDVMNREDPKSLLDEVKKQIKDAYDLLNEANKHFWPAMQEPTQQLASPVLAYVHGDFSEAKMAWQYSYASWAETPGALKALRLLRTGKWPPSNLTSVAGPYFNSKHYGRFNTS